jgi:hypothetical protein
MATMADNRVIFLNLMIARTAFWTDSRRAAPVVKKIGRPKPPKEKTLVKTVGDPPVTW